MGMNSKEKEYYQKQIELSNIKIRNLAEANRRLQMDKSQRDANILTEKFLYCVIGMFILLFSAFLLDPLMERLVHTPLSPNYQAGFGPTNAMGMLLGLALIVIGWVKK